MNIKQIFHYFSYLQYPLLLAALYFAIEPYLGGLNLSNDKEIVIQSLNNVLIFMGLGVSFSTLQDTTKTQNKMSKKVWESPVKGKVFISFLTLMTLFLIITGLMLFFDSANVIFKDVSFGLIIMGIGMIGLLKASVEMFENHRLDKNPLHQ